MHKLNLLPSLYERIGGEPGVQKLLKHFYADIRQHAFLGPVFDQHITDWPVHLEKIGTFWAQVTGGPSGYGGGMPAKHLALGINAKHFQAWLQLWEFNCAAQLRPLEAREMISLAHEIGHRLKTILRVPSENKAH